MYFPEKKCSQFKVPPPPPLSSISLFYITVPSEYQSHGKNSNSVNDLADAASLFKTVIDSQVASLSDKPLSEQKASAKSLTKKIKDSKASRIQGEGNRIQFSFNEEIIDDLDNLCTATTINNEIKEKLLKEEQTD